MRIEVCSAKLMHVEHARENLVRRLKRRPDTFALFQPVEEDKRNALR
jgi:hypothetical protein